MDYSPQGSSVYGISQERILEWVAISFSRGSSNPGIIPACPTLAGVFFTTELPGKTPEKLLFNHWLMSNSLWPHGLEPARLLCGISQTRILKWVAISFSHQGSRQVSSPCGKFIHNDQRRYHYCVFETQRQNAMEIKEETCKFSQF